MKCCKKDMYYDDCNQNMLDDSDSVSHICLVCGKFKTITTGYMEEEELQNFKENYNLEAKK